MNDLLSSLWFDAHPRPHSATHKVRSLKYSNELDWVPSLLWPKSSHLGSVFFSVFPIFALSHFPAISHSLQTSCCLGDQVSDTPTPHTSLWLFLHTLGIISTNLCKEPRDSRVSCHPLLLPYLKTFRDVFVPIIPKADLGNQIPACGFILAYSCYFYSS